MPNPNYSNDSHNETFRLAVTESLLSVFSSVGIVSPGMSNKACGRAVCRIKCGHVLVEKNVTCL